MTISLSNEMQIHLELYPEVAPVTCENFITLAKRGFYEGTIFHRIIENFMIQGGSYYVEDFALYPKTGVAAIKGEFSANGVENNLLHTAGTLSMARTSVYDSATSGFFICSADCSWLNGQYAAFGRVTDEESLQNVIEISKLPTYALSASLANFPYSLVSITSITVTEGT